MGAGRNSRRDQGPHSQARGQTQPIQPHGRAAEAEEVLSDLTGLDPDPWAEAWSKTRRALGAERQGRGG